MAYIMTLSEVVSDFNERIKQAVGLDAGHEKFRQQVRMGKPKSIGWKVNSLCSKEEGSMFQWVDCGKSC